MARVTIHFILLFFLGWIQILFFFYDKNAISLLSFVLGVVILFCLARFLKNYIKNPYVLMVRDRKLFFRYNIFRPKIHVYELKEISVVGFTQKKFLFRLNYLIFKTKDSLITLDSSGLHSKKSLKKIFDCLKEDISLFSNRLK